MEPGILAAIVILGVELVIIIVVLAFLFSGRCPLQCCKKEPSPENGDYKKTEETDDKKPLEDFPETPPDENTPAPNLPESCDLVDECRPDEKVDADTLPPELEQNVIREIVADELAKKPVESSSSSSDEGVGDVQKTPSIDESSSSSSESEVEEPAPLPPPSIVSTNTSVSSLPPPVEEADLTIPKTASSNPPASLQDGIVLSLRLDSASDAELESSSSSASSSSSEEDEIRVFRTFESLPPESNQGMSIVYDPASISPKVQSSDEEEINNRDEIVAGVINVTSGEKLTISQAISKGLIPERTGMLLLEAQAATGSVVNPRTGVKLSVDEALRQGVVDQQYKSILRASEGAYYGYLDPRTNESVPLYEAMKRGIFPRSQGMRLLEAQVASGGIVDPWTGKRYTLSKAVKRGLVDKKTSKILTNPEDHADFVDPHTKQRFTYGNLLSKCIKDLNTGLKFLYLEEKRVMNQSNRQQELIAFRSAFKRTVTVKDLLKAGLISQRVIDMYTNGSIDKDELYEKVKPYLFGEAPIAGIYNRTNREVLTICGAVNKGLLRKGTALELLEAQVATGHIIDPKTGKHMSINRAISVGLVDGRFAGPLRKAETAIFGNQSDKHRTLSLFESVGRGHVVEIQGIRLLDAQVATGGIVDPLGGFRIPLPVTVKGGMLNHELANKLAHPLPDEKAYYDPNRGENVTYGELLRRSVVDKKRHLGMRLLPMTPRAPNVRVVNMGPTRGGYR